MSQNLALAEARLLAPAELAASDLERVFARLLAPGVDFADLYFQHSRHESWSMEDGIVKDGTHSIEQGVGVRAVSGEKTGFAYSDELRLPALLEAAGAARAIARGGDSLGGRGLDLRDTAALYPALDPIETLDSESKVRLLREVDAYIRSRDPRVRQVMVSLAAVLDTVLVARSDGTLAADVRPLVRCNVTVIVEQGARREQGYCGGGGRHGYDELLRGGRCARR